MKDSAVFWHGYNMSATADGADSNLPAYAGAFSISLGAASVTVSHLLLAAAGSQPPTALSSW